MLLSLASLLFLLTINSVSPTTINSLDDVITVSATASGLSNVQYLQAVFTKEGETTSNYFGFTKNLADIVKYVEQLQELNVDQVVPTSHAVPVGNVLRSDIVKPSLTNQEALAIAVDTNEGCFKVPLVIE